VAINLQVVSGQVLERPTKESLGRFLQHHLLDRRNLKQNQQKGKVNLKYMANTNQENPANKERPNDVKLIADKPKNGMVSTAPPPKPTPKPTKK
jgi:hypothetical protein